MKAHPAYHEDPAEEEIDYLIVHTYPTFGKPHEWNEDCWCHPEWDVEVAGHLIHNVEN